MVLEQFIIDADIIWDQVGKTFFENPEAKPGRIMRVQVVNAGIVEDLTGYTLNLGWTSVRDPSKFGLDAFDDVDITKGIFEIEYTSGMLTNVGPLNATLQLVPPGEGRPIESNNFKLTVKNSAINPEAIQGETSFKALENALVEVNGWNTRIDLVEQEFKDRADALDGAYPVRLTAAEQSAASAVTVSNTASQKADAMAGGSPRGVYATLALLQAAYPSGTTGAYLVTADGNWYYWNGAAWTSGGVYQSSGIADNSIVGGKLAPYTVAPDRILSFKTVGIIVGGITLNVGAGTITVNAGTQAWYDDSVGGGVAFTHLTDAPEYLAKVHNVSFAGGAKAILVDTTTKVFIVVDYYNAVSYRNTHRLYGVLYANRLLGGDRDNAFVTTIINGTTTFKESKLYDKSVGGGKIADGAIKSAHVEANAIMSTHLADGSVGTTELVANSVTNEKILNDTVGSRKLLPGTLVRNYPLSGAALGYRNRIGDGKSICWGDMVHQLFFIGKKDRYYISSFWHNHQSTHSRKIEIKSQDGTDTLWFEGAPTYDGEGALIVPSKEYVELKDSTAKVRGYAVVSWSGTANIPDYEFVDTEIHASCFVNLEKLKTDMNLVFTEDYGVSFYLDTKYYATVGREFNLYFDSILTTKKPEDVYYVVSASGITYPSIKHFDECVRFLPTLADVGDKTITISVRKISTSEVIASATTVISILADTTLTTPMKVLFLGDSLTEAVTIQKTAKDMYGDNCTLYGTRGTAPYLHEGRSSWSANEYLTVASKNSVPNPFYNPALETTYKFDFAYYMSNNPSFADVDVVNVFLGRNDGYNGLDTANKIKSIVDNIHAFNPDIIVTVMSAYHTGFTNAGTGQYMQNTWGFRLATFSYNTAAKTVFGGQEANRTFLIPQHVNLDTVYDYPHSNLQVSARNTETVYRITDNVHPNSFGYMKMADVWYNTMQYIRTLITI